MFKQSNKSLTMDGFGGIGSKIGGGRITDAVNLRLVGGGAMKKRCGYRCAVDAENPIRACYSGYFAGSFRMYLLTQDTVYSADLQAGTLTPCGTVENGSGNACFFCHNGSLYLSDGKELYVMQDGQAIPAVGYAPLLGKDWPCDIVGKTYEPRNLLCRHARISYLVGSPASSMLCTKYAVESVEAVYLNDKLLASDRYMIDPTFNTVNISGLATGDRVLIYLTFRDSVGALSEAFLSCTDAVLFGGAGKNRLFFWGGSMPSTMFCSAYTDEESLEQSKRHYPGVGTLYVPEGYEFQVGDGRYLLRGAVPHHDHLLIFTEGDTWMATDNTSGAEALPIIPVHPTLGCNVSHGAVAAGNHVLTVGRHGILQWNSTAGSAQTCQVQSISSAVDGFFARQSQADWGLFYHEAERLLLCHHRTSGNVLLCDPQEGEWYRYTDLFADSFFDADGAIGFWQGSRIFVLDPTLSEDHTPNGERLAICAEYAAEQIDFGHEQKKILAGISLCASLDERSGAECELTEDGKRICIHPIRADGASAYGILDQRTPTGRFRHLSLRLRADGSTPAVFYRLSLHLR